MKKILLLIVLIITSASFSAQKMSPDIKSETETDQQSKPAEFPGGINALYQKIIHNFDKSKIDTALGPVRGVAIFTVTEDGSMDNIKVDCTNENVKEAFLKALQKVNVKWIPAMEKGIKKKSLFRLPLMWSPE